MLPTRQCEGRTGSAVGVGRCSCVGSAAGDGCFFFFSSIVVLVVGKACSIVTDGGDKKKNEWNKRGQTETNQVQCNKDALLYDDRRRRRPDPEL